MGAQQFLGWVVATYGAVLASELIGDRSLFSAAALATQYSSRTVFIGLALGFMAKAGAAVILGDALSRLPHRAVLIASAISFFIAGVAILRRKPREMVDRELARPTVGHGISVAFLAVFLTEWADLGQLTTAALAVRSHAPVAVWCGATLALSTKGLFAVTVGAGLTRYVSERTTRLVGAIACLVIGVVTLLGVDG